MLDPDRHANRWRSNSDFTTGLFREPGMHCRRRMANQGFRSAQTDRQFEYLKAIEKSERFRLISFDVEGECRTGRTGLPLHQLLRGVVGGKQRRIMDARHLGV